MCSDRKRSAICVAMAIVSMSLFYPAFSRSNGGAHVGIKQKKTFMLGDQRAARLTARGLDKMLMDSGVHGYPMSDRVRLYAWVISHGKDFVVGWLSKPAWADHGSFLAAEKDNNYPETWDKGFYFVDQAEIPSRVAVTTETDCESFKVVYDVSDRTIQDNMCLK